MIDDPRSDELGQIRAELAKQRANNERLTATRQVMHRDIHRN